MTLGKFILGLTLTLTSCCSYSDADFNFSTNELSFLKPFKSGDTLYYENSSKEINKVFVIRLDSGQKKECGLFMAKPASNSIWVSIKPMEPVPWRPDLQNKSLVKFDTINSQGIIKISKFPQEKK